LLGNTVWVTVTNDGDIKLTDMQQWDVILQYTGTDDGLYTKWYTYSSEWSETISDVFEPDILNPGEQMAIQIAVSPSVKTSTSNLALIVTPNGISATAVFTR
jgi:hypothetical protein